MKRVIEDMREKCVNVDMTYDRPKWKKRLLVISLVPRLFLCEIRARKRSLKYQLPYTFC